MGKFGCLCGKTLSNTQCPSPCIYYVYSMKAIERAISENPKITLWDFHAQQDEYSYWYCHDCKRFYQYCNREPRSTRIFSRQEMHESEMYKQEIATKSEFFPEERDAEWEEIAVYSDIEIDVATEEDFTTGLKEFVSKKRSYRLWLHPENMVVQVYDWDTGAFCFAYTAEDYYKWDN